MRRIAKHIIIPAMMTVLFFVVALTPVEVLGCFLRGLIALLISLVSGLAALAAAIIGTRGRTKGWTKRRARYDKNSSWWAMSSVILVIPVVAMLILA
jgi:uncharacterized membrane protein YidH (DUF202 family)